MSKKWRFTDFAKTGLILFLLTAGAAIATPEYQNADSLKEAVRQAIEENLSTHPYHNIGISVRSLDSRLRLSLCDSELIASVTNPSQRVGRVTTEVRCEGSHPWKIYVQAAVSADMEIPVLVRPLSRGALVGPADVQLQYVSLGQQQQPFAETLEAVVGMELRRSSQSGEPLLLSQLAAPNVIKRGQQVNIRYDASDLQITMSGKALQNGARGDWISAENASSGRRIEGRVDRDGAIVIPGR